MCYFVPDIAVNLWPGRNGFTELWVRDGGGWAGQLFSVPSAGQHEQPDWSRWESWLVSLGGGSNDLFKQTSPPFAQWSEPHNCFILLQKNNQKALAAVMFRTRYHDVVWSHMSTVLYHGAVMVVYHCIFVKKKYIYMALVKYMSKNMVVLWYLWINVLIFLDQ